MWPLIKREAKDVMLFAVLPSISLFVLIIYLILETYEYLDRGFPRSIYAANLIIETSWGPIIIMPVVTALLGLFQIRWDRFRGASTFLATQPTSRQQLLAAKIFSGGFCILVWVIVITGAYLWVNYKLFSLPHENTCLIRSMITCGIFSLTAYVLGLLVGQYGHLLIAVSAAIILTGLLLFMLFVKGFTPSTDILFAVITLVSLYCTWRRFVTTPI
ncbi:MAG: hypothetical protein JW709_12720 [Sedimentisphaerales bacterium]|nr:hypothetical protein [Sedimentisphaerales bacterium]